MTPDQGRLREMVDLIASRAGYDLEELTVVAAGRRRMLRVVVDADDGVDLDDAAELSREISEQLDHLDAADPMGAAAYTLEVTSPGIGRPLSLPRHYRRAQGRQLALVTVDGESLLGRVLAAGDDGVDLLVGKSGTEHRHLPYADIGKARVEVEFSAPSAQVLALLGDQTARKFQRQEGIEDDDER